MEGGGTGLLLVNIWIDYKKGQNDMTLLLGAYLTIGY